MIYGDDPLKLNGYTMVPNIHAIMQSGNLYVYCMNNPIMYVDTTGDLACPVWAARSATPTNDGLNWLKNEAVQGGESVTYTYDDYHNRSQMMVAGVAEPYTTTYTYNADGLRASKTVAGGTWVEKQYSAKRSNSG